MFKPLAFATGLLIAASATAFADCPAPASSTASGAIIANQQRTICLLQQIDATANKNDINSQIDTMQNRIDQMTVQRRFDNLPKIGPIFTPSMR